VVPTLGFLVLAFVLYNARASAQILGVVWLVVGIVIAIVLYKTGRMQNPVPLASAAEESVATEAK
jgi:uncharacterized membrane protein HdeD (DUF308 family)